MNWAFVRREWGAVTFVLTVLVGMIIVPLALYFNNQGPSPVLGPALTTTTPATATSARLASPTPSPSPTPSHSPSPTPTHSP